MSNAPTLAAVVCLCGLSAGAVALVTRSAAAQSTGMPFLQLDRCYRFTFSVVGATNWKVLEVLDAGWIKAEVSSGPSSTEHEPTWINTMQLVTVREARCSG